MSEMWVALVLHGILMNRVIHTSLLNTSKRYTEGVLIM